MLFKLQAKMKNNLKLYIWSYNVYALGFSSNITSFNKTFSLHSDTKYNLFEGLNLIMKFHFIRWDEIVEI